MLAQSMLFIDDDLAFLDMIERTFRAWNKGEFEMLLAHSAGQAITFLQNRHISIAVIDIHMPVVDGIQFLHLLHRKHPNMRKVVMTGYAEAECRAACLKAGAELFLQKPRTAADFDSVFASITELLRVSVHNGFTGTLQNVGLHEILQLECLARRSSILEIVSNTIRGRIFIREGSISHAETNGLAGQDAFYYLLSIKGGAFQLNEYAEPVARTINGPWEYHLMESARLRDEAGDTPEPEITDTSSLIGELPLMPFSPLLVAPTPPEKRMTRKISRKIAASMPTPPASKPAVEECVVSNADGTVRTAWKSPEAELRANFIEFLRFKTRQIGQGLQTGAFRRLEAYTVRDLIVAEPRRKCGLYVRGRSADSAAVSLLAAGEEQMKDHLREVSI